MPRKQYAELERVNTQSGAVWFEVYLVARDVYALYEPHQWQEVISYLVLGSERALLFDSGLGVAPIRPVVEELTQLPVVVVNSHTHYDHVGGNYEFDEVWARDTEYTRARTTGQSSDALRAELAPEALCAPLPTGVHRADFSSRPFAVQQWIGETATVDLGDRRLEVVAIPGHSPDSVALFDEQRGHLFVGDSFYEGPIWLFDEGTDLVAYRASLRKLEALAQRSERVFVAHNTPVAAPQRLSELRAAFEQAATGAIAATLREDGIAAYEFERFSLLVDPAELQRLR